MFICKQQFCSEYKNRWRHSADASFLRNQDMAVVEKKEIRKFTPIHNMFGAEMFVMFWQVSKAKMLKERSNINREIITINKSMQPEVSKRNE